MIKVRFAPSPTGYLHIGGARTALFNWMYARAQKGIFVLRIEDTDQIRSKKEYEEEILKSMKWLGMDWDELYYQSQRFDIYREKAEQLVKEGKAYLDNGAILLKTPKREVKFTDLIRGDICFDTTNFVTRDADGNAITGEDGADVLKDEVLMKADGSPAYSFCCVVDDALMEISTVIRGEDHISNTPKQIIMYDALGFKPPKFAHLPLIMGEEGGRLSKRHGAVAVSDYRRQGFLPDALVNYLMLLGWSPGGDQEIISMKNALQKFSIKKINKTAAVFSLEKLGWVNAQYIKNKDINELTDSILNFMKEKEFETAGVTKEQLKEVVKLYKSRMHTFVEFFDRADFIFKDDFKFDDGVQEQYLKQYHVRESFDLLAQKLANLTTFDLKSSEEAFKDVVSKMNITTSDLVHPVRVALTGKTVGPGLFETMVVLGKEKTVARLKKHF
ncbi:MAG: glutamate--tRNA ligase [Candidatus Omnitrophica bacterium]|nr:glutamate--tRNA ligase [Candidatus Omnitrophota bacterium]